MRLHRILPDSEIPDALKRPLVFGDTEQIAALNVVDLKVAEYENRAKKGASGVLRKWNVDINFTASESYTVLAEDEEEAEKLALEKADEDHCGSDATVVWCREIKAKDKAA